MAHSPSLLAIESYPLLAMASRAYRSMTIVPFPSPPPLHTLSFTNSRVCPHAQILPEDIEGSEGKEVKKMEFTRIVVVCSPPDMHRSSTRRTLISLSLG